MRLERNVSLQESRHGHVSSCEPTRDERLWAQPSQNLHMWAAAAAAEHILYALVCACVCVCVKVKKEKEKEKASVLQAAAAAAAAGSPQNSSDVSWPSASYPLLKVRRDGDEDVREEH